MTEQDTLVEDYMALIKSINDIHSQLNKFLASGKCSTFRPEVFIELSAQIKAATFKADCIIALIEALDEQE